MKRILFSSLVVLLLASCGNKLSALKKAGEKINAVCTQKSDVNASKCSEQLGADDNSTDMSAGDESQTSFPSPAYLLNTRISD